MLPRNTVVCVAKNHGRDGFPKANSLEVGCEATSDSVPALPLYRLPLERLFHLATIQAIEIKRLPDTVCKDRPRLRVSARLTMLFELGLELGDERNRSNVSSSVRRRARARQVEHANDAKRVFVTFVGWTVGIPGQTANLSGPEHGTCCSANDGSRRFRQNRFQRDNDGMLTALNINPNTPNAKKGDFYCPNLSMAYPTNHVAISLQAVNGYIFGSDGPPQLATYTADSSGNLTTKSIRFNMPKTAVKNITGIGISPSGKLIAVSGTAGLRIVVSDRSKAEVQILH